MHMKKPDLPGEGSLTAQRCAAATEQICQASAILSIQGAVIPEWAAKHPVITVIIHHNTF